MSIFNLLAGYNYDIRSAIQSPVSVIGGGGGGGGSGDNTPAATSRVGGAGGVGFIRVWEYS